MEKLIVKYNGNGFLHIPGLGITFRRGDSFDLVSKTGLTVEQLENNPELFQYIGNSLEIISLEKNKNFIKEKNSSELNKKIDILLQTLTPEALGEVVKKVIKKEIQKIDLKKDVVREDVISDEEGVLHQNILKELVFKRDGSAQANLQGYGKIEKKIDNKESDGLEDLIDF